jgi:GntR family transcriptional regulator, transcriptional repressor for pyruvate dehydrogenase complex
MQPSVATRSSKIHAALRAEILAGRLAPGEALPSERRLSEDLAASRHAVREALKRLEQAGLVAISQGGATRVRDWRRHGGLELLLALAADGGAPPELKLERAVLEMRASVGADAARRCAERAGAAERAELVARAERIAVTRAVEERIAEYEAFWDLVVEGSGNLAYRLALTTLQEGQRVLAFDAGTVGAELDDPDDVRRLAGVIADGDAEPAGRLARSLLERSVPEE